MYCLVQHMPMKLILTTVYNSIVKDMYYSFYSLMMFIIIHSSECHTDSCIISYVVTASLCGNDEKCHVVRAYTVCYSLLMTSPQPPSFRFLSMVHVQVYTSLLDQHRYCLHIILYNYSISCQDFCDTLALVTYTHSLSYPCECTV